MRIAIKVSCLLCHKPYSTWTLSKHIPKCQGIKTCPVCTGSFTGPSATCSYSCANKHFRTGENNGNWKGELYRSICFQYHKKECVVCGHDKIVAVHHYDENHENNDPKNLIPLCPTHHQMMHSNWAFEIQDTVDAYYRSFA
jgi:hypothetical protein